MKKLIKKPKKTASKKIIVAKKRRIKEVILIVAFILISLLWSAEGAFFGTVFIAFLIFGWKNEIILVFALIFITSCPVLLFFGENTMAEQIAVYAYLLLVIMLALQTAEYKFGDYLRKKLW